MKLKQLFISILFISGIGSLYSQSAPICFWKENIKIVASDSAGVSYDFKNLIIPYGINLYSIDVYHHVIMNTTFTLKIIGTNNIPDIKIFSYETYNEIKPKIFINEYGEQGLTVEIELLYLGSYLISLDYD